MSVNNLMGDDVRQNNAYVQTQILIIFLVQTTVVIRASLILSNTTTITELRVGN